MSEDEEKWEDALESPQREEEESGLSREMHHIAQLQLQHALAKVDGGMWQLFVNDGEMKMYKTEQEIDGVVCDPLKAVHFVKGVTAKEYTDLFFDPSIKHEWDDTLVKINVVEWFSEDAVVIHQLHRRMWPTAQREALFWSRRMNVSEHKDQDAHDAWMICNHDTKREDVPLANSSNVRVRMTVAMLCQTVISSSSSNGRGGGTGSARGEPVPLTREGVSCKITYVAQVHPGGWVPVAGLRQVYKKEYPKFLRQFTKYVVDSVKSRPLTL